MYNHSPSRPTRQTRQRARRNPGLRDADRAIVRERLAESIRERTAQNGATQCAKTIRHPSPGCDIHAWEARGGAASSRAGRRSPPPSYLLFAVAPRSPCAVLVGRPPHLRLGPGPCPPLPRQRARATPAGTSRSGRQEGRACEQDGGRRRDRTKAGHRDARQRGGRGGRGAPATRQPTTTATTGDKGRERRTATASQGASRH